MACIKAFLHSGLNSMLWIYLLCPLVSCAIFLEAGPQDKTVVDGDKVSLICDMNNYNNNTIYWTYFIGPGRRRYISSNGFIYPSTGYGVVPDNYKLIVDQSQQIYKLVILAINLATEAGIYDCGYDRGTSKIYTPLASAMITVTPFPESVSCHQFMLSSLGSEGNKEFEVSCSWTHSQPGEAHFDSSSGGTTDVDLRFPGRIISRIESRDTPSIICRFMLDSDTSSTVNAPCFGDNTPGLVRVDPFISKVTLGSSASFVCTSGNQTYSRKISWNVNVNGSDPLDCQDRLIENNDVLSIVHVQDDDQDMLVECQVHISEDLMVSGYASLRIVENTTPPSRRSPGETLSNRTTDRTTQNSIIEVTRPLTPRARGSLVIALAVIIPAVIPVILIFVIIKSFRISFFRNKRKIKCKMNRKVKLVRTNLSEESPLNILNVIQMRDPNRGDHSETEAQRIGELSWAISSDSHPYSSKIYRSDVKSCSTVLESDLNTEPNCDRQTRHESCQIKNRFKKK